MPKEHSNLLATEEKIMGFAPRCLCLDLEVDPGDKHILKIGALRPDTDAFLHFKGRFDLAAAFDELDRLATGASFVLGHNVIRHDLNLLKAMVLGLKLLELPVVVTGFREFNIIICTWPYEHIPSRNMRFSLDVQTAN